MRSIAAVIAIMLLPILAIVAQTSKKPVKKTTRPAPAVKPSPEPPAPEPIPAKTPAKKNERPGTQNDQSTSPATRPNYFYEFTHPYFDVSKIVIEHDENGVGKITILKKDWSEPDSDPIRLSEVTLGRIRDAYDALDFLNSSASYQYEKDYSHLGTHKFRLVRNGKERETSLNWTENKEAKILMDEYRKIGNQYVWIFDMNVARTNQPLEAPQRMDAIDSYLKRKEISDPVQLIPYLKEVSLDERIPLIARNHAARLIERIEKESRR